MTSKKQGDCGFTDSKSARIRHRQKQIICLVAAYNFGLIDWVATANLLGICKKNAQETLRNLAKKKLIVRADKGLHGFIFFRLTSLGITTVSAHLPEHLAGTKPPSVNLDTPFKTAGHDLLCISASHDIAHSWLHEGETFEILSDRVLKSNDVENHAHFYPDAEIRFYKDDELVRVVCVEVQQQYESKFRLEKRLNKYAAQNLETEITALEVASTIPSLAQKWLKECELTYASFNLGSLQYDERFKAGIKAIEPGRSELFTHNHEGYKSLNMYSHDLSEYHSIYYLR